MRSGSIRPDITGKKVMVTVAEQEPDEALADQIRIIGRMCGVAGDVVQ